MVLFKLYTTNNMRHNKAKKNYFISCIGRSCKVEEDKKKKVSKRNILNDMSTCVNNSFALSVGEQ